MRVVWVLVTALTLGACVHAPAPESPFAGETVPTAPPPPVTSEIEPAVSPALTAVRTVAQDVYLDNLRYDVWIPTQSEADGLPMLVLVHGDAPDGAKGMAPLAEAVAANGAVVMVIDVDMPLLGARHPEPLVAASCALATARLDAASYGADPDNITLVGYDFGALVAMIVGLDPTLFLAECPAVAVPSAARIVGISGPYDLDLLEERAGDVMRAYFESSRVEQPGLWASGDPAEYLDRRPGVPVLIAGGRLDTLVPFNGQAAWARLLEEAGHPTEVAAFDQAGHTSLMSPGDEVDDLARAIWEFVVAPLAEASEVPEP